MGKKVSLYIADPIWRIIGDTESGELSGRIADIVDRYGTLCQMERTEIERVFSEAERHALAAAIWSTMTSGVPAGTLLGLVLADFEDSAPDGLYDEWKIDGKATARKLRALNIGQQLALVEYLERMKQRLVDESEAAARKSPQG